MAQFKAYRLPEGGLVLDLRSDLVATASRVVAPLVAVGGEVPPLSRLEPLFEIDGALHALHVSELLSVRRRFVSGEPVADLSGDDYPIRRALDVLFSGF